MAELICVPKGRLRRYRQHKMQPPGQRSGIWEEWFNEIIVDEGPDFQLFRWVHRYRCIRCGQWFRAE